MPSYTFKCDSCGAEGAKTLTFSQYREVQSGSRAMNCECSHSMSLVFNPTSLTFGLKEGESGGWVTKALREKTYRARHNQVMSQRQRDHVNPNKLVPNYQGEEAKSWSEVQQHVRAEKGELAASTYRDLVGEE